MDTIPELLTGVLETFRAGAPYLVRLIVAALCGAAIDLLTRPERLEEARAEFTGRSAEGYVCPIEPGAVPVAL